MASARHRDVTWETELSDIIRREKHHVIDRKLSDTSELPEWLIWCPVYLKMNYERARGRKELHHHFCYSCRQHVLGLTFHRSAFGRRQCVACAFGQRLPDWYYHNGCMFCQPAPVGFKKGCRLPPILGDLEQ